MSAQMPQLSLGSNPPTAFSLTPASPQIAEDQRLVWAATRLRQKLWASEQQTGNAARLKKRLSGSVYGYLRLSTLSFLLLGGWATAVGLMITPALVSLTSLLLLAPATVLLALGLAGLAEDIRAAIRHRAGQPAEAFRTFFRSVTRGNNLVAYGMLAPSERSSVVRKTPNVPGLNPSNDLQVTFDNPHGFASYWRDTLQRSRPAGWEDEYSVLSWPMRWLTIRGVRVRRVSERMAVVSGELVLHHLPYWVLVVSAVFLGIPAIALVPRQYRRVVLKVKKAMLRTGREWAMLNGELLSAEDIAGAQMSREGTS